MGLNSFIHQLQLVEKLQVNQSNQIWKKLLNNRTLLKGTWEILLFIY